MSAQNLNDEKLEIIRVRGFPLAPRDMFEEKVVEEAMDFKPNDGDIILCAYPKTGSTWMMYVIRYIIDKGISHVPMKDMYFEELPYLERTGTDVLKTLKPPRVYKYHLPYSYMTHNKNAKYIYMHRNPEDVLASYFPFNLQYGKQKYDLEFFFEAFLEGNVGFGSYFDHVRSYYDLKDDRNILFVSYEDMKSNTRDEILKIGKFLGEEFYKPLTDDDFLQKVIEATSYGNMKKNFPFIVPIRGDEIKSYDYFRKGIVGDGRNQLNSTQLKKLKKKMLEKMAGTEFVDVWLKDV